MLDARNSSIVMGNAACLACQLAEVQVLHDFLNRLILAGLRAGTCLVYQARLYFIEELLWRIAYYPEFPISTLPLRTIIRQSPSCAKLISPWPRWGGESLRFACYDKGQRRQGVVVSCRPVETLGKLFGRNVVADD